jgi:hypothetical protein
MTCDFQTIMKDRWMNIAYEDDELRPFVEPEPDLSDPKRIGKPDSLFSCMNSKHYLLALRKHK